MIGDILGDAYGPGYSGVRCRSRAYAPSPYYPYRKKKRVCQWYFIKV